MSHMLKLSLICLHLEYVHLALSTDSTAEGCAIELRSNQHSFTFNMSRHNGELVLLECFPVPEAGVFSVYTYEVQYGEIQTHVYNKLHDVIIKKTDSEKNCCFLFTMCIQ